MKFTIDTVNKTVTILEKTTFKEMLSVQKFIGNGWEDWHIQAMEITVKEKEYIYNHWWGWYPQPWYPIVTVGGDVHVDLVPQYTTSGGDGFLSDHSRTHFMFDTDTIGQKTFNSLCKTN